MTRRVMLGGLFLLILPLFAYAQNYLMWSDVLSESGVEASSTSYILQGSVAQPVIGLSTSSSYIESAGFWHIALPSAPGVEEKPLRPSFIPRVYSLNQNFPNPATNGTTIQYGLPKGSRVVLRVYDVTGRLVVTLVDGMEEAGYKRVTWDGRDGSGREVATGTYFYRLTTGSFTGTRKLVILR